MMITKDNMRRLVAESILMSEGLRYHLDNSLPLVDNIYRAGSERFFSLICEARKWYNAGILSLLEEDLELIESDLGEWALFEGKEVALDFPIEVDVDELMTEGRRKKKKSEEKKAKKEVFSKEEKEVRHAVQG